MKINRDSIRVAFVGAVVPRAVADQYPAYSQAGALFQERLLAGLAHAGLAISQLFSVRPVPSFPHFKRWWFGTQQLTTDGGFDALQLPFVNFGPVKTATLAATLLPRILAWGWRERSHPYKIVLLYNVASPPAVISLLAARLIGAKTFAVVADLEVPGSGSLPNTFLRRVDFQLQTRSLRYFDGLIVLTRQMVQDFAPQTPFIHMEGAVPDDLLRALSDTRHAEQLQSPQDSDTCTLMYAGGLSELKGIPLLLDAFDRLEDDGYRLWITGKGDWQPQVEQAAADDSRITYWGFLSYEQVLSLYRRATILVNPHATDLLSAKYLFPSKLVEYMATGRPIITTSTADVEAEYGDFVYVLRDVSPAGLARLIGKVAAINEAERDFIGGRAQSYVLKQKTWQVQGLRIAEFIRQQTLTHR